jgi:large subunit ribosomal protein L10
MKKEQKAQVIDEIAAQIKAAEAVYAVDYRGLSVTQAAELRTNLRAVGASFRVVKNTLTLRAADKAGAETLKPLVEDGPTALTFVVGDAALAAKALDTFARQSHVLELKGGVLDGRTLEVEELRRLARLPGREQLNAQLAGIIASPVTGLVRGLGALLGGLAVALGQVREQRGGGEATAEPEAEVPAEPEGDAEAEAAAEAEETSSAPEADGAAEGTTEGTTEGAADAPEGESPPEPSAEEQQEQPESEKEAE